ncbi:hypothetical protein ACIGDI_34000 [Streptomyces sp. NPDC085900]|uniref:hypothetical protein n=1 Tax=Streptomyces sp. NPDC085900 TaxID=3365737 RepID=UPI0037CEAB97
MILVATHVLPERDEQLAALERWVSQYLKNTTDPVERRLLHAFVTWHYLRRLRRKHHPERPLSPHTAANVRYCLAQSGQFLHWLREHGVPLTACSQYDIDTWLAEGTVMRFKARGFVRWAARHNHIRRPVTFPPMPSGRPYRTLPDGAWSTASCTTTPSPLSTASSASLSSFTASPSPRSPLSPPAKSSPPTKASVSPSAPTLSPYPHRWINS